MLRTLRFLRDLRQVVDHTLRPVRLQDPVLEPEDLPTMDRERRLEGLGT